MSIEFEGRRGRNERKYGQWKTLPHGGRRYWYDVSGHNGWLARYLKQTDAEENTTRFWQEIYDSSGKLVEIHVKYPIDSGHQLISEK